jgi:quinoprotein glucose dehydrogenase
VTIFQRVAVLVLMSVGAGRAFAQADWPTYGHDAAGQRYSPLTQINPGNVDTLKVAWVYHMKASPSTEIASARPAHVETSNTPVSVALPEGKGRQVTARACSTCHTVDIFSHQRHSLDEWSSIVDNMVSKGMEAPDDELDEISYYLGATFPRPLSPAEALVQRTRKEGALKRARFGHVLSSEVTPVVAGGMMFISSPYHKIVALNPENGQEIWNYGTPGNGLPSQRGVEYWPGDGAHPAEVLCGTRDGKLIALVAKTGKPVAGFGINGVVDMRTPAVTDGQEGMLGMTSPPIMYKNLVITGSIVPEFPGKGPWGDVRAWNVLTGKLVWTFHSVPRRGEKGHETWKDDGWKNRTGVNAWGFLTVDAERGIVYMPFGAPSWDRYGGDRKGDNLFSTSLVAADANTGKELWHFQVVHHDIWDYDLQAAPILFEIKHGAERIPAVAIVTKSGMAFFLNRVTGKAIYPIEERAVPKSDVPDEEASPTQPFPTVAIPVARQNFSIEEIATVTPELEAYCSDLVAKNHMVSGPVYTPVAYQRTLISFPGPVGGANWGGASFNPELDLLFVNTMDLGQLESIFPAPERKEVPYKFGPMMGRFWDAQHRLPCQQPPWGRLSAIDVDTGKIAWQVPLGTTDSFPEGKQRTGRPNLGGSITTAGGVVFIGATDDSRFRAFDAKNGAELWSVKLAAPAHAVPSTYEGKDGKQYVVVTSAGGSDIDDPVTDTSIVAFSLP